MSSGPVQGLHPPKATTEGVLVDSLWPDLSNDSLCDSNVTYIAANNTTREPEDYTGEGW